MRYRLDRLLRAAGDLTRLRILNLLSLGSICVCDLQALLRIPQPTVSRHLAVLRNAGLVLDARHGTRIIYSLAPATTSHLKALHEFLAKCCPEEETMRADLARFRKMVEDSARRFQYRDSCVTAGANNQIQEGVP